MKRKTLLQQSSVQAYSDPNEKGLRTSSYDSIVDEDFAYRNPTSNIIHDNNRSHRNPVVGVSMFEKQQTYHHQSKSGFVNLHQPTPLRSKNNNRDVPPMQDQHQQQASESSRNHHRNQPQPRNIRSHAPVAFIPPSPSIDHRPFARGNAAGFFHPAGSTRSF